MGSKVYYSPFIPTFSGNGLPVANARLYFFYTGTTDLAPIYEDSGLTIPMDNPVISDGAARYSNIYLDEDITYRVRETGADGTPLAADIDPYYPGQAVVVVPDLPEFAAPTGAALVGYVPRPADADSRTVQDKIDEAPISVTEFEIAPANSAAANAAGLLTAFNSVEDVGFGALKIFALAGVYNLTKVTLSVVDAAGTFYGRPIILEGETPPPCGFGTIVSGFETTTKVSIFKSTTAGTAGVINGGAAVNFLAAELTLRNLIVRREPNPSGPGIDGYHFLGLHLDNVTIDCGQMTTDATEPTNIAAYGVRFPAINNAASHSISGMCAIQGFYTGMLVTEHTVQSGNLSISGCINAMELEVANHPSAFQRLSDMANQKGIVVGGENQVISIQEWAIEHGNSAVTGTPAWQDRDVDLDDPTNIAGGKVNYRIVLAGVGPDDSLFSRNGGFFIRCRPIGGDYHNVIVSATANISIPDDAWTAVAFNALVVDNLGGVHSTTINPSRITPLEYGSVALVATVVFAANATGNRGLRLYQRVDAADHLINEVLLPNVGAVEMSVSLHALAVATEPGTYFWVEAYQNSTGALNVLKTIAPDDRSPRFSMVYC